MKVIVVLKSIISVLCKKNYIDFCFFRELQVVFIYDTLRCRKEEDDPSDAILYFHPQEISEARRIAICGQLMGITQFLVDMFSKPKILSLENGKFALKELGKQYILVSYQLYQVFLDFLYNQMNFYLGPWL